MSAKKILIWTAGVGTAITLAVLAYKRFTRQANYAAVKALLDEFRETDLGLYSLSLDPKRYADMSQEELDELTILIRKNIVKTKQIGYLIFDTPDDQKLADMIRKINTKQV